MVLVLKQQSFEAKLLGLLLKYYPNPTREDALTCFKHQEISDEAIKAAEAYRKLAQREDEIRKLQKKTLINYREFYVGSVFIGLIQSPNSKRKYEWCVFGAFNTKPSKRAEKYCAEKRNMRSARKAVCALVGAICVVGVAQPDGRSGVVSDVLDPCGECRDDLRSFQYFTLFTRKTQVLLAQPGSQTAVLKSMEGLMTDHREIWPASLTDTVPGKERPSF